MIKRLTEAEFERLRDIYCRLVKDWGRRQSAVGQRQRDLRKPEGESASLPRRQKPLKPGYTVSLQDAADLVEACERHGDRRKPSGRSGAKIGWDYTLVSTGNPRPIEVSSWLFRLARRRAKRYLAASPSPTRQSRSAPKPTSPARRTKVTHNLEELKTIAVRCLKDGPYNLTKRVQAAYKKSSGRTIHKTSPKLVAAIKWAKNAFVR